jgi:hypothetical protein
MGNTPPRGSSVIAHMVRTYTTFSGVDITALFDDMALLTLQGLAISITREKVPVYVFGRSRPVSISRGKRGIAGTLQFVLFDRDAMSNLYTTPGDDDHWYYAHADEVNWLLNTQNAAAFKGETRDIASPRLVDPITGDVIREAGDMNYGVARSKLHQPEYMDQIWPFDITLVAQNEYGQGAWSVVVGVEIINEGGGISMDDLTNEEQATYIAIHRHPWSPLESIDARAGAEEYWVTNAYLKSDGKIGVWGNKDSETPAPQ